MGGIGLFIVLMWLAMMAAGDDWMIYKTVYGEFKGGYIDAGTSIYWVTETIVHKGFGYALLQKTYQGSYDIIKIFRPEIW